MTEYAEQNTQVLQDRQKEYRQTNKDKLNSRFYDRLKTDPAFKMRHTIRTRLNRALTRQSVGRTGKALYGCSWKTFVKHVESLWLLGMAWENHGRAGWHLDHVLPLSKFDLSDPKQLAAAQHYTNLQPLWAADNIRKRDRIEHSQECPTPRTGDDVR